MPWIVMAVLACTGLGHADTRLEPIEAQLQQVDVLRVVHRPSQAGIQGSTHKAQASRGGCPSELFAHTDSNFGPGEYVLQAGFEEGESAGISFTLPAAAFPVRLDVAEILFATSAAIVSTTTEWSILVYSGTPASGSLVAEYSSDGVLLPHLEMPPGTTGTIIQFSIAPDDPQQIFIDDDGTQTVTVAFRIDSHHTPGNPCISAPPSNQNAFPSTDVSGLDVPAGNWLDLVPGAFCICGEGWLNFQQLPSICRPSGDWVMRASVTPFDCGAALGACCKLDGSCIDATAAQCATIDGTYQGDGSICDVDLCPEPTGACCVQSTQTCVDSEEATCEAFGGTWLVGQLCDEINCFPVGACCLLDGTCVPDATPESCAAFEGLFQGDGTSCATVECPEPEGWCCTDSGDCFNLTEATCNAFGGAWGGGGSTCDDADACNPVDDCEGDLNQDGSVNVDDILEVLSSYGQSNGQGDVDGDGDCDVNDVLAIINSWGDC